jgi:hypothetical protein
MLHFKNGRFNQFGVSFALPSEFFFDSYDEEHMFQNGIRVLSENKDYYAQFAIHRDCKSTSEELERLWCCGLATALSDIEEVHHNGLHGHRACYSYDDGKQYFEMCLDLPDNRQFSFLIETEGRDILKLIKTGEIQNLIREIRAE